MIANVINEVIKILQCSIGNAFKVFALFERKCKITSLQFLLKNSINKPFF